jgi:hypothetical protein
MRRWPVPVWLLALVAWWAALALVAHHVGFWWSLAALFAFVLILATPRSRRSPRG